MCKQLTKLVLTTSDHLADVGLAGIAKITKLQVLDISQCYQVRDAGILQLTT